MTGGISQDDIDSLLQEVEQGEKMPGGAEKGAAQEQQINPADWGLEETTKGEKSPSSPATHPVSRGKVHGPRVMAETPRDLEFLMDIPLRVSVEVGRTKMTISELLSLGPGSIVELDKLAGEPLDIYINQKLIARGEAVIINEKFGVRLTDVVSRVERIETLKV
jgi:flagellar motor switch protein FliN